MAASDGSRSFVVVMDTHRLMHSFGTLLVLNLTELQLWTPVVGRYIYKFFTSFLPIVREHRFLQVFNLRCKQLPTSSSFCICLRSLATVISNCYHDPFDLFLGFSVRLFFLFFADEFTSAGVITSGLLSNCNSNCRVKLLNNHVVCLFDVIHALDLSRLG